MNIFKRIFGRREPKCSMLTWAENEVKLAIEREHEADRMEAEKAGRKWNPKEFSYGGEIYKSALRAYKLMAKDGHSGMSWSFTREALMRLMRNRPLTPLKGTDDEWHKCGLGLGRGGTDYQNIRCCSLFKNVAEDGTVSYSDVERVTCVDEVTGDFHHLGLSSQAANDFFPIKFPFMPSTRPYKVIDRTFSVANKPGEYDTVGVLKIVDPDGKETEVGRFYKEVGNEMVQICREEYEERLKEYKANGGK